MKKKNSLTIIIVITLLFSVSASAQKLYLKMKDGSQSHCFLNEIRKLTFSSGNLVLTKTAGNTNSFLLNNLRYISFSDLTAMPEIPVRDSKVLLFPVPASDILNVSISDFQNQSFVIEIMNIEGKVIYQSLSDTNTNIYQINISILPKGLYLCRVFNCKYIETVKFNKL